MKNIKIYNIFNNEWDKVVKSFSEYSVFYLSGYVNAFRNNGEGEPVLFYYNDGDNRGINVVFKRDVSETEGLEHLEKNMFFDLITPYGYGGFIFEGESAIILKAYNEYCKKNNIICEFTRFNLFSRSWEQYDGEIETRTHNVVRNLDLPIEDVLMAFKHKVRKNIRQANENGLIVEVHECEENLDDFLAVYYHTMKRNNAKESFFFKKRFFEDLNNMENNVAYFYVKNKENEVISTELVIYDKNNCYSYLGGTNSEYYNLKPNEILKYEIIKWAYVKKLKNFVLGGGYGSDDGIYEYKLGFAPQGVYDFYIGRKIFNNDLYEKLCKVKNVDTNNPFFPAYRS